MNKELWVLILLFLAIAVGGVMMVERGSAPVAIERSPKPRVTTSEVSEAELLGLARSVDSFSFDLYRALEKEGNLFFSPYSITMAFAMLYGGASGDTAREMALALGFPAEGLHPAFNALDLSVGERAKASGNELVVANAIWAQRGFPLRREYLDLLAEHYGAGVRRLDFRKDPEGSRALINNWVKAETKGKIEELFPPGSVGPSTLIALTNAVYFKGLWKERFEPAGLGTFHLLDGGEAQVEMMRKEERLGYMAGQDYQAVEIPYKGGELSMVIILPDEGKFREVEERLSIELLDEVTKGLREIQVKLSMPTFSFSSGFSLKEPLEALGMEKAFSPEADFSGMSEEGGFYVTAAVHKAFIRVDEEGTEAAAATGISVGRALAVQVVVDRPFIFLIRDRLSNTILFLGRVTRP